MKIIFIDVISLILFLLVIVLNHLAGTLDGMRTSLKFIEIIVLGVYVIIVYIFYCARLEGVTKLPSIVVKLFALVTVGLGPIFVIISKRGRDAPKGQP